MCDKKNTKMKLNLFLTVSKNTIIFLKNNQE